MQKSVILLAILDFGISLTDNIFVSVHTQLKLWIVKRMT